MESNQTASRAARRFLDDRVRNDWAYPDIPPAWSASDEEVRHAQDFRERYYGESESSDSNADHDAKIDHDNGTHEAAGQGPYKFDSPDSIGPAVAHVRHVRKRRRRERLESDMKENEGLRLWVERRDQWTGAASVKKYGARRSPPAAASSFTADQGSDIAADAPSQPVSDSTNDTFDIVPVAPRLLADNAIRASITTKAYSDIYQKIVVSSRTPAVPINLADMTRALVQGWKESDEWPPKPALADPLIGKKRAVLNSPTNGHHGGFMDRHPHLEKSVDSVKRILHLNGHHQTPEQGERSKS